MNRRAKEGANERERRKTREKPMLLRDSGNFVVLVFVVVVVVGRSLWLWHFFIIHHGTTI